MMYEGHIIYDVRGEEKKNLQVSDLLKRFEQVSDGEFAKRPYAAFLRQSAQSPLQRRLRLRNSALLF